MRLSTERIEWAHKPPTYAEVWLLARALAASEPTDELHTLIWHTWPHSLSTYLSEPHKLTTAQTMHMEALEFVAKAWGYNPDSYHAFDDKCQQCHWNARRQGDWNACRRGELL